MIKQPTQINMEPQNFINQTILRKFPASLAEASPTIITILPQTVDIHCGIMYYT